MMSILLAALIVGLSVPGVVLAVRALPFIDRRVLAGQKPWACDVCMCFWVTGLLAVVLPLTYQDATLFLACGPAYTLSLIVLRAMTSPLPGEYPIPPESEEPPP